jgi:anti-sigma factor RsiW
VESSDCQDTKEMLDLYLDNELLIETSHSLLHHLGSCPDCIAESERRLEVRSLLKAMSMLDDDYQRDTEQVLRRRIEAALQKEQRWALTANIRWALLAASLILLIGLAYWRFTSVTKPTISSTINLPTRPAEASVASFDRDAVGNHQACALTYPPSWTYDRQRVVRELTPRFASLIDAVGRNHSSYQLIEGHICSFQTRQYAHLIFRGNGHTVSVFIEQHEPITKPVPPSDEIAQTQYTSYEVASVDTQLHRIYLVSDLTSDENIALAKQLFPGTLGFVQKLEHGGA